MKCPICGCTDSKVVDSRPTEHSTIRRRRECLSCKYRFTTYEAIEMTPIVVIKKDGSKELFDKNKLFSGLLKSCYKRPVTTEQLETLVNEIENEFMNAMKTEVTSEEIGTKAMEKLRVLDEVSYVRFASVYREFKDIETFLNAINQLRGKK